MELKYKTDAIKYLKYMVVKTQKYEFASWLRDREKEYLKELNLPIGTTPYDYTYDGPISHQQYVFLEGLISEFEEKFGHDESNTRKKLYENCIAVIRESKIDNLLGDS